MLNEVQPNSKLDHMIKMLEVLYILNFADEKYEAGKPLVDSLHLEYGSSMLIKKVFEKRYYHPQTIIFKINRLKKLGFIKANGVVYRKKQRKVPVSTRKGRSSAAKSYLVYELTPIGKQFLQENMYLLHRFGKVEELEGLLRPFTSRLEK